MLQALLFTPTTVQSTRPAPSVVQPGFPTVVWPSRVKPLHADPLNSSTHRALSVTPKTPQVIWFVLMTAQLPLVPISPPKVNQPPQLPVAQAPPLKRLTLRLLSVPRAKQPSCPL